jgi:RNA exonuclease 1
MSKETEKEPSNGAFQTEDYIPLAQDGDNSHLVSALEDGNEQRKRKRGNPRGDPLSGRSNRFAVLEGLPDTSKEDREELQASQQPSKRTKRGAKREELGASSDQDLRHDAKDEISSSTKPRLVFAGTHRVNSTLRLGALQQLILYCIADDVAPNWIGVHKHAQVRKAVILMVPGLEKGMFTGDLKIDEPTLSNDQGLNPTADETAKPDNGKSPGKDDSRDSGAVKDDDFRTVGKNPDDCLPISLEYRQLHAALQPLGAIFDRVWPVKTPGDDRYNRLYSPVQAILSCPLPKSESEKKQRRHPLSTPAKLERERNQHTAQNQNTVQNQKTPITRFLVTNEELHESEYPVHPACVPLSQRESLMERRRQNGQAVENGWRDSNVTEVAEGDVPDAEIEAGSLTAGRNVYTLDCEMCMADEDFVLTRVSMVDWAGGIMLDEIVKPDKPITNYLTQFSGITEEILAKATHSHQDIQEKLLKLITPRTILAGHSLESDLRALKLTHPFLVDTALIYPHPIGPPLRSSLKFLAQKYLGRVIQQGHGNSGHDSVEDARATLALIQMKCEKGPSFGNVMTQQESIMRRISRSRGRLEAGDQHGLARRSGAIVDLGNPERTFPGMAPYYIGAEDDAGVVKGLRRAVQGDPDGAYIPGGGVDFVWARLRGIEAARGWSAPGEKGTDRADKSYIGGETETANDTDTGPSLAEQVATTVAHIQAIHDALPPCTLFIVYSGTGNAQELFRLQDLYKQFRREYAVKKWDELGVQWTDTEEQALKKACGVGRHGMAMMTVT